LRNCSKPYSLPSISSSRGCLVQEWVDVLMECDSCIWLKIKIINIGFLISTQVLSKFKTEILKWIK
jgi:hypothetical protein